MAGSIGDPKWPQMTLDGPGWLQVVVVFGRAGIIPALMPTLVSALTRSMVDCE
ncbi:MAG: hypothetical protein OXC65_13770 [Thiotrichales bacterium]|nr:hypothetical protein [Thiotrichales bacterium]